MTEIALPWHPESEKPTLPFVICTNGDGHYWLGRWFEYPNKTLPIHPILGIREWQSSHPIGGFTGGWTGSFTPLAWCDPTEFVPFKKEIIRHKCTNPYMICLEDFAGLWLMFREDLETTKWSASESVNFCPFCGYKAEGK